ncbi:MAG: rhomboid family intramembrane serine protease [Planctomycetota bacterium]
MILPIKSDRRLRSTPVVNTALIAINVLVFALTYKQVASFTFYSSQAASLDDLRATFPVVNYYLWPDRTIISLWQFFTYQFLHADFMHLLGNMVFLWAFGNSVEDRLGKAGYLLFYLGGGVLAGLAHVGASGAPVLGASGAVAGVTGAFLALFPLSNIRLIYFFIFIFGSFEVSGLLLIAFYIGKDILFQFSGGGGVAYVAHLGGYAFGLVVGLALLRTRLLEREPYDLLALLEQRRRRRQFRSMTRDGQSPWSGAPAANPDGPNIPLTPEETELMRRRAEVSQFLNDHKPEDAARAYVDLLRDHPGQAMPQAQQLEVANALMATGAYDHAAAAYGLLLSQYPTYPQRQQVQLILGLIFGRYLGEHAQARDLLTQAEPKLSGQEQTLARQVLSELPPAEKPGKADKPAG